MEDSFWNTAAKVLFGFVAFLLLFLIVRDCTAQNVGTDINAKVEVWANKQDCYQNRFIGNASVNVNWNGIKLMPHMGIVWWGACDAKIVGSLLNAEAGKVLERKHGIEATYNYRGFIAGFAINRRAVHHIWRNKNRHPWFPGNWQLGRSGMNENGIPSYPKGQGKPSIGYYDGIRGIIGYKDKNLKVRLYSPFYVWKTSLTLPYPSVSADLHYKHNSWFVDVEWDSGWRVGYNFDIGIRRKIVGPLSLGIRYGHIPRPGWIESSIKRFTTFLVLN